MNGNDVSTENYAKAEWMERVGRRTTDMLFAKAFHLNPSPMAITTFAEGRCTDANEAMCQLSGYERAEIVGQMVADLNAYEDPLDREAIISELQKVGRVSNKEVRFRTKSGLILIGLLSAELIQIAGCLCFLTTIIDITERKLAQDALFERNEELVRANRLKDEFLSMLSHELRTPLNAILGWSKFLTTKKVDAEQIKNGLEVIHRNSYVQSQMIEDLLVASQLISKRFQLDQTVIDLSVVVKAALNSINKVVQEKQTRLETQFAAESFFVVGDAVQLEKAIFKLLSNAVKFTPENGTVKVITRCQNQFIEVIVNDDGTGIEPEFLPHVFDWFRQADQSTARLHGGLGLGLAIVKPIVELHNGSVKVESEGSNRGATFTISLPLCKGN